MKHSKLHRSYYGIDKKHFVLLLKQNVPLLTRKRGSEEKERAKPFSAKQRRTKVRNQKDLKHKSLKLQFNKFGLEGMVLFAAL